MINVGIMTVANKNPPIISKNGSIVTSENGNAKTAKKRRHGESNKNTIAATIFSIKFVKYLIIKEKGGISTPS